MTHRPRVLLEFEDLFNVEGESAEEVADPFEKFLEAADLAAIGVTAAKLEKETAPTDRIVAATYQKIAANAEKPTDLERAQNPLRKTEPASSSLAKRMPGKDDLHRVCLREFLKKSLANGETVASVAAYARQHDPATADLLEEIGAELT